MTSKKNAALVMIGGLIKKKGKGKKGRKIGRYSKHPSSVRYRSERRWVVNQIRRVRRHLKAQPNDEQARAWFADFGGREAAAFLAALPKKAA